MLWKNKYRTSMNMQIWWEKSNLDSTFSFLRRSSPWWPHSRGLHWKSIKQAFFISACCFIKYFNKQNAMLSLLQAALSKSNVTLSMTSSLNFLYETFRIHPASPNLLLNKVHSYPEDACTFPRLPCSQGVWCDC